MSEKCGVGQIPPATSVVGHDIRFPGDIVVKRDVAVPSLVQCIEAEEVRACGRGGGGAFCGPGQGRLVVACQPNGALGHGGHLHENVFVCDSAG